MLNNCTLDITGPLYHWKTRGFLARHCVSATAASSCVVMSVWISEASESEMKEFELLLEKVAVRRALFAFRFS